MADETVIGWAIVELMGHRRLGGHVSEQEIAGQPFLRFDVPGPDGAPGATQFYGAGAVYCITPTTQDMATAVARRAQPTPVHRWELPAPRSEDEPVDADVDDDRAYAPPGEEPF